MAAAAATEGATIVIVVVTVFVTAIEDTDYPEDAIGEDGFAAQGRWRVSANGRECMSQNACKVYCYSSPPTHPRAGHHHNLILNTLWGSSINNRSIIGIG